MIRKPSKIVHFNHFRYNEKKKQAEAQVAARIEVDLPEIPADDLDNIFGPPSSTKSTDSKLNINSKPMPDSPSECYRQVLL